MSNLVWGCYGPFTFIITGTSPSTLEGSLEASYAEHPVLEGKPRIQWLGEGLRHMVLRFAAAHAALADPMGILGAFEGFLSEHRPYPLVMANGEFIGLFVVKSVKHTRTCTQHDGDVVGADITVELLEWIPDSTVPVSENPAPVAVSGAPGAQSGPN